MATKRRIGINPGTADYVSAVDTDARDGSGNTITTQAATPVGASGNPAEISVSGELYIRASTLEMLVEQNRKIVLLLAAIRMQLADIGGYAYSDSEVQDFVPATLYDS